MRYQINLRLRAGELELLQAKAAEAGLSTTDFLRQAAGLPINRPIPLKATHALKVIAREEAREDVEPGLAALQRIQGKLK